MKPQDIEDSLRNILKKQLRELVNRCVPKAEWVDRAQISVMLERMINAWVNAEPERRQAVLSFWLEKISSYVADAKAVRGVKAGKSLVVSAGSAPHTSGRAASAIRRVRIARSGVELPFDLLETKLGKLAPPHRERSYYEVQSEKIAELLNLSKSKVDLMREKLRDSGFDFSFLNAVYVETSGKNSGKRAAGSKHPRSD